MKHAELMRQLQKIREEISIGNPEVGETLLDLLVGELDKPIEGLKVFVWPHFNTDYTDGLAVAIAHDETEAKELVAGSKSIYGIQEWGGDPNIYPVQPSAFAVSGGG